MISSGPTARTSLRPVKRPASGSWQESLRRAIRDPRELIRLLKLSPDLEGPAVAAARSFGLLVPREYADRMVPGDPNDPLLRQVLPLGAETLEAEGFSYDPVGDVAARSTPGLLQKYSGRALLVVTGGCPVHCRYCFRRHYPYAGEPHTPEAWLPALEALAGDPEIHEVILSGGDPLVLSDSRLADLAGRLAEIGSLRRLRVHSRMPVMIPTRVNDQLLGWLAGTRLRPMMVLHANHPAEIGAEVEAAVGTLLAAGVAVLNQAVLLKGVNDDLEVQVALWEQLADLGVGAYYLHQLDRVRGASHFEVRAETGRKLHRGLRARLPGHAVPRYVQEVAGEPFKVTLA
jgi:EF-P beta-lysylation protein EpmB